MLIDKIRNGIKSAIFLHKEFGVSYFQLLRSLLKKNKTITIHIRELTTVMDINKSLFLGYYLWNIKKYGWKIVSTTNGLVVYENRQKGIRLYSRIDDDWPYSAAIHEIYVQEVYKSDFKNKVIIDVGAYKGESAIYFATNGAKKVIALEPDEDNYKLALLNIKENGFENKIMLLNKALAPIEGVINFYKYLRSTNANSIDPNNMVKLNDQIIVKQVETVTLNQLIKMVKERIGLLKLDCEGCEYTVLNSFSDFDMIDNIILEYHNEVQNLPNLLKSHGFEVTIEKANEKTGIIKAFKK